MGPSGLQVILIDVWEGGDARREVLHFCDIWGIGAPVLLDETAEYLRRLGLRGVPSNVLVDADGTVRAVGVIRPDELETAVERLLAGVPPPS